MWSVEGEFIGLISAVGEEGVSPEIAHKAQKIVAKRIKNEKALTAQSRAEQERATAEFWLEKARANEIAIMPKAVANGEYEAMIERDEAMRNNSSSKIYENEIEIKISEDLYAKHANLAWDDKL